MTTSFTYDEMAQALEAAGYIIVEENEILEDTLLQRDKAYVVWNVYQDGVKLCDWGPTGFYRVEYVFNLELSHRLLKLFHSPSR